MCDFYASVSFRFSVGWSITLMREVKTECNNWG